MQTLFFLLFGLLCITSLGRAASPQPNIVFIFTDDHSPNAIGAYGRWLKSLNPTPAIDNSLLRAMARCPSRCQGRHPRPSPLIKDGKAD